MDWIELNVSCEHPGWIELGQQNGPMLNSLSETRQTAGTATSRVIIP